MCTKRLFLLILLASFGSTQAFGQQESRSLRDRQIQQRLERLEADIRVAARSHRLGRTLEPERLKDLERRLESLHAHSLMAHGPAAELAQKRYPTLVERLEVLEGNPRKELAPEVAESPPRKEGRLGSEGAINDSCESATSIGLGQVLGDTTGAASEGETDCWPANGPALWYRFVAPTSGGYFLGIEHVDLDTVVSAYDSCPGTTFNEITCNDHYLGGLAAWRSGVDLDLQAGEEIWVRVGSPWEDSYGEFSLVAQRGTGFSGEVTFEPPANNPSAYLSIFDYSGYPITTTEYYGSDLRFRFYGLAPGTYYFHAESFGYAAELYDGIGCSDCEASEGTPIEVRTGEIARNIDIELTSGATVEGRITKLSNGLPVYGCVSAWSAEGRLQGEGCTDYDGLYRIEHIQEGPVYLMLPTYWSGIPSSIYNGIACDESDCDPTVGEAVYLVDGETTSSIDFVVDDGNTCLEDDATLCVWEGAQGRQPRFRVSGTVSTSQGGGFDGTIKVATPWGSGGLLYFLRSENPEILVKILDGCVLNQHFWVFYAAATNLGFEITVEDLERGVSKTYQNPDRTDAVTVTDTSALATCP